MTEVQRLLAADGPFPEHSDVLMLYGRFVGAWRVHSRELRPDGAWTEREGEWHFGWVLGGRGIQDVLFAAGSPRDRRGTTLRCYDPGRDLWHITWMAPGADEFSTLIGRGEGDSIVQEGTSAAGDPLRWTFTDIEPSSFTWRGERDGRLEQEMGVLRM